MTSDDSMLGPRGGVTTIAPSGWQKTSVYLRQSQIRELKLAAIDCGTSMSALLRRAVDLYLGLAEKNPRAIEVLRDLELDERHLASLELLRRRRDD